MGAVPISLVDGLFQATVHPPVTPADLPVRHPVTHHRRVTVHLLDTRRRRVTVHRRDTVRRPDIGPPPDTEHRPPATGHRCRHPSPTVPPVGVPRHESAAVADSPR